MNRMSVINFSRCVGFKGCNLHQISVFRTKRKEVSRNAALNLFCTCCSTNPVPLCNAGNLASLSLRYAMRITTRNCPAPNHPIYQQPCTPVVLIQQPRGRPHYKCHQALQKTCCYFVMQSTGPNIHLELWHEIHTVNADTPPRWSIHTSLSAVVCRELQHILRWKFGIP
jgi:hypothetical protein